MMDAGIILRRFRGIAGYSQTELADRLGLHRTAIARIENGTREVTLVEFFKIIDALDIPYMDFYLIYSNISPLPPLRNKKKEATLAKKKAKLEKRLEVIKRELDSYDKEAS